jgi:hypothetical protein
VQKNPSNLAFPPQLSKKLIIVLEQEREIGTMLIQMIQQETSIQTILVTSFAEVRTILWNHLEGDLVVFANGTLSGEDLARFYPLSEDIEPPVPLSLAFHFYTYDYRNKRDVKSVFKAVNLLLSICDCPVQALFTPIHNIRDQHGLHFAKPRGH